MAQLLDRHEGRTERGAEGTRRRPVVLGTLSVRVDPSAERMAIDSALNLPHEEDLDAVRATARRAAELGVETELLRVTTRRPITALLEIVRERNAGLLVFGPDLRLTGRLRFRLAARRLRREAGCLIWVAPDG
jgi:nucleotide-binding universal stress UspA family protein